MNDVFTILFAIIFFGAFGSILKNIVASKSAGMLLDENDAIHGLYTGARRLGLKSDDREAAGTLEGRAVALRAAEGEHGHQLQIIVEIKDKMLQQLSGLTTYDHPSVFDSPLWFHTLTPVNFYRHRDLPALDEMPLLGRQHVTLHEGKFTIDCNFPPTDGAFEGKVRALVRSATELESALADWLLSAPRLISGARTPNECRPALNMLRLLITSFPSHRTTLETVKQSLTHSDPVIRAMAASHMGTPRSVEVLRALAREPSKSQAHEKVSDGGLLALRELVKRDPEKGLFDEAVGSLRHGSSKRQRLALQLLRPKDEGVAHAIADIILTGTLLPDIADACVVVLRKTGEKSEQLLVEILDARAAPIAGVMHALSLVGGAEALNALNRVVALDSEVEEAQQAAIQAIGDRLGVAGGGLSVIEPAGGKLSLSTQAGGLAIEAPEKGEDKANVEAVASLQSPVEESEA